jgi:hypothetical protein
LQLTQAFKQSGKTKRFLQEQRSGRQFHIRQALGVAGPEGDGRDFWRCCEIRRLFSRRSYKEDKECKSI